MPRLTEINPDQASGQTREIFDQVKQKMGKVPNIFKGMGNSPAALKTYLDMSGNLKKGALSDQDREVVYLATSELNGCFYCVSAHTGLAKKAGLSEEETLKIRQGDSSDPKHKALATFARRVVETRGFVSDDDLQSVRDAGYDDGQIAEAVGMVALATFSNFFNHVHDTPLDFPEAKKL